MAMPLEEGPSPVGAGRDLAWGPFAVAAVCSAVGFLWLDQHGLNLSRDSVHYLNVAVDLRFEEFALPAEPAYPVGYPWLVAQAMRIEPFAVDAARIVSWLSYVLMVGCGAALFRRVAGPLPASIAVGVLATMPSLIALQNHALSDAPFGALILAHLLLVVRHAESSGSTDRVRTAWLAAAAAILGLATVVRVIGYAAIVVFSGYVLWLAWRSERRPRELAALLLAHAPCYLPALAIGVAYSVIGRPVHGYRGGSREPFALNVDRAIETFANDLGVTLLIPALVCVGLLVWRLWGRDRPPRSVLVTLPVVYALVLFAVYVCSIVVAASLTKVSPVGPRFFAPYYGVFFVVVLGAIGLAPARAQRAVSIGLSLVLIATLASNARLVYGEHRILVQAGGEKRFHFQLAFEASPSTKALRDFLGTMARADELTSLSILSPLPRGGHHEDGGRSLLFVRAALASPVESVRFDRVEPQQLRLWLGDAPEEGGLMHLGLAIDTATEITAEITLTALVRAMAANGRASHWLLVPYHVDPLRPVKAIEGLQLLIAERADIGAYRAYRFELAI